MNAAGDSATFDRNVAASLATRAFKPQDGGEFAIRARGTGRERRGGRDLPSLEEFYEATSRPLLTALCLVTGNRQEAEEIAQDVFVRVFERWDRVGALEDPTGYLFRVSMNVFRSRLRRASLALRPCLAPDATDDLAAVETHDAVVSPA